MTISGFTIVRNGVKFDYPFIESLQSLLPLCDEVVINVGASEDDTRERIRVWMDGLPEAQRRRVKVIESVWPLDDPEKRKGGRILAEQTNIALDKCTGDWCVYLQADEVLHEKDIDIIRGEIKAIDRTQGVDGLVLNYVHFYGTFDVIQQSRSAYRREIRVFRNRRGIRSVGDAQGFRHFSGDKIQCVLSRGRVFHYGWVRPPQVMKEKTGFMDTLYHEGADASAPATGDNYKYKRFVGLKPFAGEHPKVMAPRVEERLRQGGGFDFAKAPLVFEAKDVWKVLSGWIEAATDIRPFEYKNYRLLPRNEVFKKKAP